MTTYGSTLYASYKTRKQIRKSKSSLWARFIGIRYAQSQHLVLRTVTEVALPFETARHRMPPQALTHIYPQRPPLHTRAWVVQERALSPRTLYYGSGMIFWECIRTRASEYEPQMEDLWGDSGKWLRDDSPGGLSRNGMKNAFKSLLDRRKNPSYRAWNKFWRKLVRGYTACQMSVDNNKWPAIAGLATEVERQSGEKLFHGLWEDHLVDELLWCAVEPGKRLKEQKPQEPSWSWLSLHATIDLYEEDSDPKSNVKWTADVSLLATPPVTNSLIVEAPY